MKTFYSFLISALFSVTSVSASTSSDSQKTSEVSANTFAHVLGFDGTNADSYVDCTPQADFSPVNFTIELWAYITGSVGTGTLISNGAAPTAGQNQGYTIRINSTTHILEATVGVGTWLTCTSATATPLTYSTWNHIALTSDGIDVKIYLNGELNSTIPFATGTAMIPSTIKLYLGEHPSFSGRRITGQLSDVRIWSIARSQSDIQSTMSNFLVGDEMGLVANWKLTDNDDITSTVNELKGIFPATRGTGTTWINNATKVEKVQASSTNVWPTIITSGEMLNVESMSNAAIRIYSAEGRVTKNNIIIQGSGNLKQIDTSNIKPGLYILDILSNDEHQVARFVIK